MKKYLITLATIIITNIVFAQNNKSVTLPSESIILNSDRDLYISGESIRFSIFCINDNKFAEKSLSKIVYVELFNTKGKAIQQQKIKIINGSAASLISIPENIETGVYNLIAYTQYMKNFSKPETNQISVVIINPASKGSSELINPKKISNANLLQNTNIKSINLSTDKKIYTSREKVILHLTDTVFTKNLKHVTVSVVKKGSLNDYLPQYYHNLKQKTFNDIKFYPEIRDLTITGSLINKETSLAIPNQKVYLSVLNNNRQLSINKTDNKGNFVFTLHSLYNKNNIIIRTEKEIPNSEILIHNSFSNNLKTFNPVRWYIDSSKITVIEEMYENCQISKYFNTKSKIVIKNPDKSIDFFSNEEIKITIESYIKLPTLKEIFNEIVPLVTVGTRNNHSHFNFYDDLNKMNYYDPLILYDNVPVFNIENLLKINPKYIEQIRVINKRYIIGNYIFNGIIFITSETKKFPDLNLKGNFKIINYQTCSESLKLTFPDYQTINKRHNHTPDFRTTLYWNPEIKFNDSKTVEFYTSDFRSEYDVIIRGISETGEMVFGKTKFRVQ